MRRSVCFAPHRAYAPLASCDRSSLIAKKGYPQSAISPSPAATLNNDSWPRDIRLQGAGSGDWGVARTFKGGNQRPIYWWPALLTPDLANVFGFQSTAAQPQNQPLNWVPINNADLVTYVSEALDKKDDIENPLNEIEYIYYNRLTSIYGESTII